MQYHYQYLSSNYPMVEDLERRASARIPSFARGFLNGGTGLEFCLRRNRRALNEILFRPRHFCPISKPDLSVSIFGKTYAAPFGISPLGMAGLVWPGADSILIQGAEQRNILLTASIFSEKSLEESAGDTHKNWFQIYPIREDSVRSHLLNRAKNAGFDTLVVTVDAPVLGNRESMRRHGLRSPMMFSISPLKTLPFLVRYPAWTTRKIHEGRTSLSILEPYMGTPVHQTTELFLRKQILGYAMSWDELKKLRDEWTGNLVIKGILHPKDAEQAVSIGAEGIWVSNHGGRQLDSDPASIDVVTEVKQSIGSKAFLFLDGGIRSGLDILRAMALGVDFVFLGRPFLYGVGALGKQGATYIIDLLINDMINHMTLLGCARPRDIGNVEIYSPSFISK